jgi:hypothetical protein
MTQWGKDATSFGAGILSICSILSVLAVSPAASQQPSPEQVGAIRSACRSDFMARCAGVTPGGADALACLRKNVAQLSPGCQTAVNAATPKPAAAAIPAPAAAAPSVAATAPAPAPAPVAAPVSAAQAPLTVPSSDQVAAIRTACPSDFAAHCAGVPPGGLEGLSCLRRNAAKLSAACRFAVTTTGTAAPAQPAAVAPAAPRPVTAPAPAASKPAARTAAAPKTAAIAPAAAPVAAAAPTPPTAEQQAAIRASCRSDFMSRCAGVQPGGADALACLKRNDAQLSAACRTAVAAIGGATTAAPAATPAGPTPAQQAAIKSACQRDFMMNCRGVQPGGQAAFMCLQRNSARLSAGCQGALAAIASGTPPAPVAAAPAPARSPGLFPVRRAIRERLMGN